MFAGHNPGVTPREVGKIQTFPGIGQTRSQAMQFTGIDALAQNKYLVDILLPVHLPLALPTYVR
jgi:hypothetical protein